MKKELRRVKSNGGRTKLIKKKKKKNQEACERTKPYFVREEEVVAVGLGARDK